MIGANIYFFTPIFFDTSVRSENTLAVNQFLRGGGGDNFAVDVREEIGEYYLENTTRYSAV